MKYLKKFESYGSDSRNFFKKYFSKNEYEEIVGTISEIEKHKTSVPIKKGTDVLVNLCLDSFVFKFYKDYHKRLGNKITKFPIPNEIYDFEDVVNNIDKYISADKDETSLFKNMLIQTKHLIVYFSYFPFIRNEFKKRFNPEKEIFELFSKFDESLIPSIQEKLFERDGLIRTVLFLCDSYNEIRWVEKYGRFVEDIDYFEKSIIPKYEKFYNQEIKDKKFKVQLEEFTYFFEKYGTWMKYALRHDVTVDDYRNNKILDNYESLFGDKKPKHPQIFEFTGDIVEDYRRYTEAYNKNR
jgi:hypothetical protein